MVCGSFCTFPHYPQDLSTSFLLSGMSIYRHEMYKLFSRQNTRHQLTSSQQTIDMAATDLP